MKLTRDIACASFAAFAVALLTTAASAQYEPNRQNRYARPIGSVSAPSSGERVFDLPLSDGGTQRVLLAAPARSRATIVMLPGGAGDVGISRDTDFVTTTISSFARERSGTPEAIRS